MTASTLERVGTATVATGIGHNLIGAWLYRRQLAGMVRDGLLDAVESPRVDYADRERRATALWFLMAGAAVLPKSGFWLLIAEGVTAMSVSRRRAR